MSDRTYTPRPVYETSRTMEAERQTIERVSKAWDVKFSKMPKFYRVDWAAVNPQGKVIGWAECKRRHTGKDSYKTFIISLGKALAGLELYEQTGIPFLIIVEWNDGLGYYKLKEIDSASIEVGGRFDRGDAQDIEPLLHIPITKFTFL